LGLDLIVNCGTPVYAPFGGMIERWIGWEGGNTVCFHSHNKVFRFLHLSKFGKSGNVKEGEIIGYVGNTGSLSKGCHLHIDISKGKLDTENKLNFINPETFNFTTMEYVIQESEQYIRYEEPFKIALNIGDGEELERLFNKGLPRTKPTEVNDMIKYEIYPLISKERMAIKIKEIRDLMGF